MGIQLNGITGDAIIPGDVGIGGTLTYEDVANVDSIGVITARDGIRCTGIVTATTTNQNITGDLTVSGNVGVGGVLTYEDVTNIDSVGSITARSGINVSGGTVTIGGKSVATTGKAIAMAMIFG